MIASGCWDGTVRLWDTRTFQHLRTLNHGSTVVQQVTFSSNGRQLLSVSHPSNYCLRNLTSGQLYRILESQLPADQPARTPNQPVAAAFHPASMYVAAAPGMDSLEIWSVMTGNSRLVLEHLGRVDNVSFSSDGRFLLAVLGQRVLIWDFHAGKTRLSLESPSGGRITGRRACFSPRGKYVASVSGYTSVRLWRSRDGLSGEILECEDVVDHVAFSPDGETPLCGTADGTVFFKSVRESLCPRL